MYACLALAEVMVTHDKWTARTNVNRVVIVEYQRNWCALRPANEATLFQRLFLRQRISVWRTVGVDVDARGGDAGVSSDNVRKV